MNSLENEILVHILKILLHANELKFTFWLKWDYSFEHNDKV